jgi:hypothetical protein
MNKIVRRSLLSALTASAVIASVAVAPAFAAPYQAPVAGSVVMRLVSPLPGKTNSVNMTSDAKGNWDQFYGKGLRALAMYQDVRSEFSLTYKYSTPTGAPLANRTVYLVVNKRSSCSKTTFYTPQNTDYPGGNRASKNDIVRDWCGDQPQMGAGETAIIATTDAFGKATFTMKNYSITGEPFPAAINKLNQYAAGVACGDDSACMQTTIAPSMVAHPNDVYERGEDKDLLFLHFVNPKVTPVTKTINAKSGSTKKITFKLTNMKNKPVKGTSVTFESWGEGNDLANWSGVSNAKGEVTISVSAPKGTSGLQVVRAYVFGSPKGTDAKVYWSKY